VAHQYVPVDAPAAARRFLAHWRPNLAVFVESELWPNLLLSAQGAGVRLALVSARLSEGSLGGWSKAPGAARRLLGAFDLVLPQEDETAARLVQLGARDDGRLNLKMAGDPLPADTTALQTARKKAAGRPVLLAASTHPGEETMALDAFAPLMMRDTLLVIAPRHPSRGPEVAELVTSRGWPVKRQGAGEPFGVERVYVADTLGELGLWFRVARAALVGGGMAPGVGGHNPLEPARLGCPAASGPGVENWRGVYAALEQAGGITFVSDAHALKGFWERAIFRDTLPTQQAARAKAFAEGQSGAVDDAAARLLELVG
jgi:3-deoxy-D-manno-octulosonic-acid transferase